MSLRTILKRAKAKMTQPDPLNDETIVAALNFDYDGFTFKWQPYWAHEQETGRLVVARRNLAIQFVIERPRSIDQLRNTVREGVLDWVWQDFTEVAGLKRETRS